MIQNESCRIQADAVKALAEWKTFFSEQVAMRAKELAQHGNPPGLITLVHYRQAATLAAQALAIAAQATGSNDDRQEAA